MSEPLIRKGEQVIVDGKLICEAKRDIFGHERCTADQFEWLVTAPAPGARFDSIPGFRSGPYGQPDIFISGQWLTERKQS